MFIVLFIVLFIFLVYDVNAVITTYKAEVFENEFGRKLVLKDHVVTKTDFYEDKEIIFLRNYDEGIVLTNSIYEVISNPGNVGLSDGKIKWSRCQAGPCADESQCTASCYDGDGDAICYCSGSANPNAVCYTEGQCGESMTS